MMMILHKAFIRICVFILCLCTSLAIATRTPQFWESSPSKLIVTVFITTLITIILGALIYHDVAKLQLSETAAWLIVILAILHSTVLVASQFLPVQLPTDIADRLEIKALAKANPKSGGTQVRIVEIRTGGKPIDLKKMKAGEGWQFEKGIWLFDGKQSSSISFVSEKRFGKSIRIALVKESTAGIVQIQWGNSKKEIDLFDPMTSLTQVSLQYKTPLYLLMGLYLIDFVAFGLGFSLLFLMLYHLPQYMLINAEQMSRAARNTSIRLILIQIALWDWLLFIFILASAIYDLPWIRNLPNAGALKDTVWWLVMPYVAPK